MSVLGFSALAASYNKEICMKDREMKSAVLPFAVGVMAGAVAVYLYKDQAARNRISLGADYVADQATKTAAVVGEKVSKAASAVKDKISPSVAIAEDNAVPTKKRAVKKRSTSINKRSQKSNS